MRKLAIVAIGAALLVCVEIGYSVVARRYALPGSAGSFFQGPVSAVFSEILGHWASPSVRPAAGDARTSPARGNPGAQGELAARSGNAGSPPSSRVAGVATPLSEGQGADSLPFSPRRPAGPVAPPSSEARSPNPQSGTSATLVPGTASSPATLVDATTRGAKVRMIDSR